MWIGFLWIEGRWQAQPSTRSRDIGTCSARLGVLAASVGLPATHQMMTGGRPPVGIVPSEIRAPSEEAGAELEEEEKL